jgi:large subunit ribosomal protein L22
MSIQSSDIQAKSSHVLVTPRKANLVLKSIVGLRASLAIKQLTLITKRAADPVAKLIKQAIGNAVQKTGGSPDSFIISEAYATKGRTLKRALIGGRSRTKPFQRTAYHMTVKLRPLQAAPVILDKPVKAGDTAKTATPDTQVTPKSSKKVVSATTAKSKIKSTTK